MQGSGCEMCETMASERLIYKDSLVFAIPNLFAVNEGHIMVLPVRHVTKDEDLTDKERLAIQKAVERFAAIAGSMFEDSPIVAKNYGKNSSQPHLHWHILPSPLGLRDMYSKAFGVPWNKEKTGEELERIAKAYRE